MYVCNFVFFALSGFSFVASFLQYFDTVGWVFWPVKTVSHITYTVLAGTLNHADSINQWIKGNIKNANGDLFYSVLIVLKLLAIPHLA